MDLNAWNQALTPYRMFGLLKGARIPYPQMLEFSVRCCKLIESDLNELQLQILIGVDRKRCVDKAMKEDGESLRQENMRLNEAGMSNDEEKLFWGNSAVYSLLQDEESYTGEAPIRAHDANLQRTHQLVGSFIARKFVKDPYNDPPPAQLSEANEEMARILREIVPQPSTE